MGQAGNRKLFDPDTQPLLLRVGLQARSRKDPANGLATVLEVARVARF